MGYFDDYKAVVWAIWNKLLEIEDFKQVDRFFVSPFQTVVDQEKIPAGRIIFGERQNFSNIQTPEVWIRPKTDTIETRTFNSEIHSYTFWITTMIKHENMAFGLWQSMEIGGKVYDKLMEDRSLGGTIADLKITEFEPESSVIAQKSILHWTNLVMVCRRPRRGG